MSNFTGQKIKDTYQALLQISGSDVLADGTGSVVVNLDVSASYATNANAAVSADSATAATTAVTASYATYAANGGVTSIIAGTNISIDQGTGAVTVTANIPSTDTGSFVTTASFSNPNITYTQGDGSTFVNDLTTLVPTSATSASYVSGANVDGTVSSATTATTADSASYVAGSNVDGAVASATSATSASYATLAQSAVTATSATTATSASHAVNADTAATTVTATSASYASNADTLDGLDSTAFAQLSANNTFTGTTNTFSNDIVVNGTASIQFLQTVTGSAKIIGDAFIILNADSPSQRYAGIKVYDSGSSPVSTGSFFWDSENNDWQYEYQKDDTDYAVALFGPEFATKGTPTYPSNNRLVKGDGGHHLNDSSITDDGSTVSFSAELDITGGATASAGFLGNLTGNVTGNVTGNATTATSASHANVVDYIFLDDNRVVIGSGSAGTSDGNTVIGADITDIDGVSNDVIAIGRFAKSTNADFTTLIGFRVTGSAANGVAIGRDAYIGGAGGVSIGYLADNSGGTAKVVIGEQASSTSGNDSVTIGLQASSTGDRAIAIGLQTSNSGVRSTAVGEGTLMSGADSVSVGTGNSIGNTYVVAAGKDITSTSDYGILLGREAIVSGDHGISMGYGATSAANGIAIGSGSSAAANGLDLGGIVTYDGTTSGSFNASHVEFTGGISTANTASLNGSLVVNGASDFNGTSTFTGKATFDDQVVSTVQALSISSQTASMDCSLSNMFTLTLGNGVDTFLNPSNITAGQTIVLKVTNNATSAGTLSYAGSIDFAGGTPVTVTATTDAVDILTLVSLDGSTLQCVGTLNFS